jgi:hypothetical protein
MLSTMMATAVCFRSSQFAMAGLTSVRVQNFIASLQVNSFRNAAPFPCGKTFNNGFSLEKYEQWHRPDIEFPCKFRELIIPAQVEALQ